MRAPRRFELGLEFIAHERMHGTIRQRNIMDLGKVLLNFSITAKATGVSEPVSEVA